MHSIFSWLVIGVCDEKEKHCNRISRTLNKFQIIMYKLVLKTDVETFRFMTTIKATIPYQKVFIAGACSVVLQ